MYKLYNIWKYIFLVFLNGILLTSCNFPSVNKKYPFTNTNSNYQQISTKYKTSSIIYEKQAKIIKQLLSQFSFQEVEDILEKSIKKQTRSRGGFLYVSSVLSVLADQVDLSLLESLDSWIEQYPESSLAYTVRGYLYYQYAWNIRGKRYVDKTPQDQIREYRRILKLCAEDIAQAIELDSENPLALLYILRVGRNVGMPRDDFEYYFSEATSVVPQFIQAYQEKSLYLAPNWHGNETELLNFARKTVASAPRGTALPIVLPQAHERISKQKKYNRRDYYNQPQVWNEIEQSYLRLIKDFPRSGFYSLWFAEAAEDAGKYQIAWQYYVIAQQREPSNDLIRRKVFKFQEKFKQ